MVGGKGPVQVATAAAIVATLIVVTALVLSFLLPEPKEQAVD
jgi:hypothetical protein